MCGLAVLIASTYVSSISKKHETRNNTVHFDAEWQPGFYNRLIYGSKKAEKYLVLHSTMLVAKGTAFLRQFKNSVEINILTWQTVQQVILC